MSNILYAIAHIIEQKLQYLNIDNEAKVVNRANNMGSALEDYIKNAFAGTLNEIDENEKNQIYNKCFSWLGNQNNPPDLVLKGGDAIEVKKIQSANSQLALNSSYPKAKLFADSPMITSGCRSCEKWTEKDLIYCVGHTTSNTLNSLWMVYGNIYAAHHDVYERIKHTIACGINSIPDVEFAETKELGRVNRVDPLGITNLRIRGMWHINNPRKVFEYIHKSNNNSEFELICIIPSHKYSSFSKDSINQIESIKVTGFSFESSYVKDPNNPAKLIEVKVIKYVI